MVVRYLRYLGTSASCCLRILALAVEASCTGQGILRYFHATSGTHQNGHRPVAQVWDPVPFDLSHIYVSSRWLSLVVSCSDDLDMPLLQLTTLATTTTTTTTTQLNVSAATPILPAALVAPPPLPRRVSAMPIR